MPDSSGLFACIGARVWAGPSVTGHTLDLGHGYQLVPPLNESVLDRWREDIGNWRLNDIKQSDVWLWTTDGVTQADLRTALTNLWSGLLLTRPPRVHSAWLMAGSVQEGVPRIGYLQQLNDVWVKESPFPLAVETLQEAARVAVDLRRAFSGELKGRLERGLAALLLAFQSRHADESILGLVRALEGILHPNHKKQFARRATVVLESAQTEDLGPLFEEIYDVRSGFTHAEAVETVFPGLSRADAVSRARRLQAFLYFVVAGVSSCASEARADRAVWPGGLG